MPVNFISLDRDTPYLFPPSIQDYLPEEHLARFIVDIVERLDLRHLALTYSGKGSRPYHPALMVSLLFYGYATGTFSSRKLERASYDSIAYRYLCANQHPDHDSICAFRQRFLPELTGLFVAILVIAQALGMLKLGTVSLDGTKVKANASKHKALSWKYANELEKQLQQEVEELLRMAEEADHSELPEELNIPEELKRREARLVAIEQAKQEIQARARQREETEQAEYEQKMEKRRQAAEASGKKPRGKPPAPPQAGPRDKDQVNLTDEESRIMPTSGGGFDQCYNAQAGVAIDSGLIVTRHVTQAPNDKQEIAPALSQLQQQEAALGKVDKLLADTGYFSEHNVQLLDGQTITPYICAGRERHNVPLKERFSEAPVPAGLTHPVAAMKYRMKTKEGKAIYAKRKSTIEPTFGIIKHVLNFRQFLLRGLEAAAGEWNLVCIGYNLKRMYELSV
jgi:transposase